MDKIIVVFEAFLVGYLLICINADIEPREDDPISADIYYVLPRTAYTLTCVTVGALANVTNITWAYVTNVTWTRNGAPITATDDGRVQTINGSLKFARFSYRGRSSPSAAGSDDGSSVIADDEGCYQCTARRADGAVLVGHRVWLRAAATGELNTILHDGFSTPGPSLAVEASRSARLVCSAADGQWLPRPTQYVWYCNGTSLSETARHSLLSIGVLQISNVSTEDAGLYHCTAISAALPWPGRSSTPAELRVIDIIQGSRELRVLAAPPLIVHAVFGMPLVVECFVDGPSGTYAMWRRQGQPSWSASPLSRPNMFLKIDRVNESHAGTYECSVTGSSAEPRVYATRLDVYGAPILNGFQYEKKEVSRLVRISCDVLFPSLSMVAITWMKNGAPLQLGATVKLQAGRQQLLLSAVTSIHAGYYQCLVRNEMGTASRTVQIVVLNSGANAVSIPTIVTAYSASQEGDVGICLTWESRVETDQSLISSTVDYEETSKWSESGPNIQMVFSHQEHCTAIADGCSEKQPTVTALSTPAPTLLPSSRQHSCMRCNGCMEYIKAATNYTLRVAVYFNNRPSGYSLPTTMLTLPDSRCPALTARALGMSAILLNWSLPSTVRSTSFKISYRRTARAMHASTTFNKSVFGVRQRIYLITGVFPGDRYSICVMSESGFGAGNCPWIKVSVPQNVRSVLSSLVLNVTKHNDTTLLASWTAAAATGMREVNGSSANHRVLFYETSQGQFGPFADQTDANEFAIHTNTNTWCEVTLVTGASTDNATAVAVTFRYEPWCISLHQPTNLSAVRLNRTAASFMWAPPAMNCKVLYTVAYRTVTPNVGSLLFSSSFDSGTRSVAIQLVATAIYEWSVIATSEDAAAAPSQSETLPYELGSASMPTGLTAFVTYPDNSTATIELKWRGPILAHDDVPIVHYLVDVQNSSDETLVAQLIVNVTSLDVTSLKQGTLYAVSIRAVASDNGRSAPLNALVRVSSFSKKVCNTDSYGLSANGSSFDLKPTTKPLVEVGGGLSEQQAGILIGVCIAMCLITITIVLFILMRKLISKLPQSSAASSCGVLQSRYSLHAVRRQFEPNLTAHRSSSCGGPSITSDDIHEMRSLSGRHSKYLDSTPDSGIAIDHNNGSRNLDEGTDDPVTNLPHFETTAAL